MPAINNTSLKNQVTRIANKLNERGENWSQEHSAVACVRAVLEEFGLTEELNSDEYKQNRLDSIAMVKPMFTASKNYQNSYINGTIGADGKTPIMPAVKGGEKKLDGEFA